MTLRKRQVIALVLLCVPLPLLVAFITLEQHLLKSGFLNTRDLGFVGGEEGALSEYLTNVWHWDAFCCVLMLLVGIGFITGIVLFCTSRKAEASGNNVVGAKPNQALHGD